MDNSIIKNWAGDKPAIGDAAIGKSASGDSVISNLTGLAGWQGWLARVLTDLSDHPWALLEDCNPRILLFWQGCLAGRAGWTEC